MCLYSFRALAVFVRYVFFPSLYNPTLTLYYILDAQGTNSYSGGAQPPGPNWGGSGLDLSGGEE